jgi:hypothetical protein
MAKPRKPRSQPVKEAAHFRIIIAKFFQSLAYLCLFVGLVALFGVIIGLVVTYWPHSEASYNVNSSVDVISTDSISWFGLMLKLSSGAMIFFEIFVSAIALLVIFWGIKSAVRISRRWTWRLADSLMKPLAVVEPLLLFGLYAATIIGAWFLIKDEIFLAAFLFCLLFMLVGLISLLIMRKLARNRLDFSRAELVMRV